MDAVETMAVTGANMLEGTQFSYGAKLYNYLTLITTPRKIDTAATTVLWTLEQSLSIQPGETVTIRGQYNNPSVSARTVRGTEMVTPVAATDYAADSNSDGSGVDKTASLGVVATFGAAEVELQLTNNDAGIIYVGGGANVASGVYFQVRGKGIYYDDPVRQIYKDDASVFTYGTRPYNIDMKYQTEQLAAGMGIDTTLWITYHKDPYYVPERIQLCANKSDRDMMLFIYCEPGDTISVTETMTALGGIAYIVQSYDFEIQGNKVFWSIVCKDQYSL